MHDCFSSTHGGFEVTNRLYIPLSASENGATFVCKAHNEPLNITLTKAVTLEVFCKFNVVLYSFTHVTE